MTEEIKDEWSENIEQLYEDYAESIRRDEELRRNFTDSTLIAINTDNVELVRDGDNALIYFKDSVEAVINGLVKVPDKHGAYLYITKSGAYLLDNAKNDILTIDRELGRTKYVYISDLDSNTVNLEVREFDKDLLQDEYDANNTYPKFYTEISQCEECVVEASVYVKLHREDLNKIRIFNGKFSSLLSAASGVDHRLKAFEARTDYIYTLCNHLSVGDDKYPPLILFNGVLAYAVGHDDFVLAKPIDNEDVLQVPYFDICTLTTDILPESESLVFIYNSRAYRKGLPVNHSVDVLGHTYTSSCIKPIRVLSERIAELQNKVELSGIEECLLEDFTKEKQRLVDKLLSDKDAIEMLRDGLIYVENNTAISATDVLLELE